MSNCSLDPAMLSPHFTIITSTLNCAHSLAFCLESVKAQSLDSYEHLIVDGYSTDNTVDVVKRYSSLYNLRLVASRPDRSLYEAWNLALTFARGSWILFLGSDDSLVDKDVLRDVYTQSLPQITRDTNFVFGRSVYWEDDHDWSKVVDDYVSFGVKPPDLFFPGSIFYNSQLFSPQSLFDSSYRICADFKFLAQHRFYDSCVFIDMDVVQYSYGGISSSSRRSFLHFCERDRLLRELDLPRNALRQLSRMIQSILITLRAVILGSIC